MLPASLSHRRCQLTVIIIFVIAACTNSNSSDFGAGTTNGVRVAVGNGFLWGATGHDDRWARGPEYIYNRAPIAEQLHLLTAAGLTAYRTGCGNGACGNLPNQANELGVTVLAVLELKPDQGLGEQENYKRGYAYGLDSAERYSDNVRYFEAGNELDVWTGIHGDGSNRSHYNYDRYIQARGLIKGLIDGVHAAKPSAMVMVDDAGWCHYGFLQLLWEDGLRWDITAFHWYSNQGNIERAGCNSANVAAIHASFHRPVWITEFNSNIAVTAPKWLSAFVAQIRDVAPKYDIRAAFVYELLDEPNLKGMEANFGIVDQNGIPKETFSALVQAIHR